ncbi:hypothetical protein [uncultured Eubacterium sp.]|uniref:hypothetical protein n=1 Tax=uncultured Eubacterium sp. TaxID=165185 RepID=UPI0025F3CBC8|nr:hypothetical protein [uncultured Eubacterium sp.]
MKKMFKKSIAMLIAVLMVISAMPFTAITAFAADTDYVVPASLSADTANAKPQEFNATAYFGGQIIPNFGGNLAYCSDRFSLDEDTDNYLGKKMCVPRNTVMVYNGVSNATYMPVYAGFYTTTNKNVEMCYVTLNWQTNTFNIGEWYGYKMVSSINNKEGIINGSVDFSTVDKEEKLLNYASHDDNRVSYCTNDHVSGDCYWRTQMYYSGTGNTTDFYEKFTNPIFQYGHRNEFWGWKNRTVNKTVSNTNIYVLNYQPIYSVLSNSAKVNALGGNYTYKDLYNEVWNNQQHYTAASVNAYYKAVAELVALDPQSIFDVATDNTVESATQTAARKIKEVYNNYISAAQSLTQKTKYTFVRNGATVKEVYAESKEEALAQAPTLTANTEKVPADKTRHTWKEYSWSTTATNYTFTEVGTDKFEQHNIEHGKCTECDYVPLDLSTYNAAITEADGIIANSDGKYTADSVNAYKTAVDTAKAKTYSTQKEIDAIISEIQSAQTLLQKARVTITFVVEKEDGSGTITETPIPADWGQRVPLDTQSNYVSKWTITVNGVTSKIDSNATFIEHVATEDATITAYVTDEKPDTKYSKVTFLGKNSAVVGIKYVAADTTVDTNTLLTVPAIPFYDASGWDRDTIVADGSDFTVKATYTAKAVNENKCNVHFNGTDKQYAYDSYVYLFNADKSKKYAMYADAEGQELITYLGGVDFSVPRRDDIYIKEVNADEMKAAIGFSGSYQQGLKSSFNVKFWLPEDATLIETGVDLVAKFPDGTVKRAHDRATKFNARNEYTYTASFGDSKKTVEFKPYLTYKKDGVKTTVYGTSQTVEFN